MAASGPITVELDYTIDGNSGSQTVTFLAAGAQTIFLNTGDGTADGTASVRDPVSGLSDSLTWAAPVACIPVIVIPTATVTPEPTS